MWVCKWMCVRMCVCQLLSCRLSHMFYAVVALSPALSWCAHTRWSSRAYEAAVGTIELLSLSVARSHSCLGSLSCWVRRLFRITAAHQLRIRSVGSVASERVTRMRARPQHQQRTKLQQFRYSRKRNNNNNNIANRVRVSRVRRASWVVSQLQFLHIVCYCCCCLCMLRRAWNIATTTTTATKGTTKRKII